MAAGRLVELRRRHGRNLYRGLDFQGIHNFVMRTQLAPGRRLAHGNDRLCGTEVARLITIHKCWYSSTGKELWWAPL